ncbi:nuclear transport factor 2 family protein [Micromonospora sp. SL4-19]|uniref:nuclear transport factor 2 family protein n=1 Tax=Micromonospora sp. SL4-19 TaxID=3399129 RepID=UPI003A4DCFFA
MTADALATELANTERRRLRALVDVRLEDADALHAPDFELVTPNGGTWSKEQYLGGIASGDINYRRFEAVSDIDVMVDGDLAVLRYQSLIDIAVWGQQAGLLECWHLDCYRRDRDGGLWKVRWSQATEIDVT